MRFACQSCGKAYNLPEEKIADKSNVKLKCRVCGAIVEVKKQGEVVAAILGEGDNKRTSRVSEAPAPLTSMMPDDSDDATHAIAVSDQILSESGSSEDAAAALMGHVKSALGQRSGAGGLGPLPPPPPTGFGSPPPAGFGSPPPAGFGSPPPPGFGSPPPPVFGSAPSAPTFPASPPPGFSPTPVPPPLSVPDLPRAEPPFPPAAPPFPPAASPLPSGLGGPSPLGGAGLGASGPGAPPPPLPNVNAEPPHGAGLNGPGGALQNGSNGIGRFGDAVPLPDDAMPPVAMASGGAAALPSAFSSSSADMGSYSGPMPGDMQALPPQPSGLSDDTTRKMLASLATGILIGFIIARLFF